VLIKKLINILKEFHAFIATRMFIIQVTMPFTDQLTELLSVIGYILILSLV